MSDEIERDELGRFTSGPNWDAETRRQISSKGGRAPRRKTEERIQAIADQLLIEAGYDPPNTAPLKLQLAARQSAGDKMDALKFFDTKTRGPSGTEDGELIDHLEVYGHYRRPEPGTRCPTCGMPGGIFKPLDYASQLLAVLSIHQEDKNK